MNQEFKLNLGRLRVPLINAGIKIVDKWLISKINFIPLQSLLRTNLSLLQSVTDKLTDKDPNNLAQLKEVWELHKEKTLDEIKSTTFENLNLLIKDPIKAEIVKEVLSELLEEQDAEDRLLQRMNA